MSKLINEYNRLKSKDKDKLYLFKVGKFYIFIGNDADTINNYMVLKKTKFSNEYLKCGFPIERIEDYKKVFNNIGLKVEIIDEIKDFDIIDYLKNIDIDRISLDESKLILRTIKDYYV